MNEYVYRNCEVVVSKRMPDGTEPLEVDSVLHYAGNNFVESRPWRVWGQDKLIVVTGDGNEHDGITSFPKLVEKAANAGILVEIWSWRDSLNKVFYQLAGRFPHGHISIFFLDND
jgi:hypothetical protein